MTHEEFMELRVGDVVDYKWVKYEITETYNNGIGIETNGIKVNLMCGEPAIKPKTLIFRRRNGLWIFTNILPDYRTFDINDLNILWKNNSEENSIEHFKKKIEGTKSELVRLENTLKGLEDSKRMKELTETLSNLIVGDFYTVKVGDNVFSGLFSGWSTSKQLIIFDMVGDKTNYIMSCLVKDIKQIIHRPNFTYDYKSLLNKIDTLNSELEHS